MQNIGSEMGSVGRLRSGAIALGLAALVGAACASAGGTYPPPTQAQVAGAEGNVKLARDSGAANDPRAARLLRDAEEQLSMAKDREAAGDNRGATLLLARAEADAELGFMLAKRARSASEADLLESQLVETKAQRSRAPTSTPPTSTPSSTSTSTEPAAPTPPPVPTSP